MLPACPSAAPLEYRSMLPFVEVSHLPSSSSLYSAILEPLGLHFLSAHPESDPFSPVTYGDPTSRTPVLQLRRAAITSERPLKRSHVVLTATSAAAVSAFRAAGLRANPDSPVPISGPPRRLSTASQPSGGGSILANTAAGGAIRATVTDFDGNTMDVVYRPPPGYPSHYNGPTVRKTQSTDDEANRIIQWNYDVASTTLSSSPTLDLRTPAYAGSHANSRSAAALAIARHPASRFVDEEPYVVRRVTTTTTTTTASNPSVYEPPSSSPRQYSSGLSTGAVVGTILGVAAGAAAGAALTLTAMRNDRARAPQQEFDAPPPGFTRRATFPDPYPDRKGRFVEVERTVEKIRYPEAYPALVDRRGPPPEYIARYRSSGPAKSKGLDDMALEDTRSRISGRSRHSSTRTRSEAATSRKPLLLGDVEHRSHASASKSFASKHPPIVQRSYTYDSPSDRESYVSARSHRSSSTVRPPHAVAPSHTVARSKAGSRMTARAIQVGDELPGSSPRGLARAASYITARNVPLPASRVGSSHAAWEDDADSIAPSDSISCVGSRRSGRPYH